MRASRARFFLATTAATLLALAACGGTVSYRTGRCTGSSCPKPTAVVRYDHDASAPGADLTWDESALRSDSAGTDQPLLMAASAESVIVAANGILPGTTWRTPGLWTRDLAGDGSPRFFAWASSDPIAALATDGTSTFFASGSSVTSLGRELGSWFAHDFGKTGTNVCALRVEGTRVVTVERDGTVTAWTRATRERRILGTVEAFATGEACASVDATATRVAVATVSTLSVFDDGGVTPARATVTHAPRLGNVGPHVTMQGDLVVLARPHAIATQQVAFYKFSATAGSGALVLQADGTDAQAAAAHAFACNAGCEVARRGSGVAVADAQGVTALALDAAGHVTSGTFTPLAMNDRVTLQDDRLLTATIAELGTHADVLVRTLPVDASVAGQVAVTVPTTPATHFGHSVAAIEAGNARMVFVADDAVVWGYQWQSDRWFLEAAFTPAPGQRVVKIAAGSTGTQLAIETTAGAERSLWNTDLKQGLAGVTWHQRRLAADALWVIDASFVALASGDPLVIAVAPADDTSLAPAFSAATAMRAAKSPFLRAGENQVALVTKFDGRCTTVDLRRQAYVAFNLLQQGESLIDVIAHNASDGLGLAVWRDDQAYYGEVSPARSRGTFDELETALGDVIVGAPGEGHGAWLVANPQGGRIVSSVSGPPPPSLPAAETGNDAGTRTTAPYRFARRTNTLVVSGPWTSPVRVFSLR